MAYNDGDKVYVGESNYVDQPSKPPTQLDEAYDAIHQAVELSNMVTNAANRLCGSVPTASPMNKLEAVSDGVLGDLSSRAKEASRYLAEATESIHRINRAFGL